MKESEDATETQHHGYLAESAEFPSKMIEQLSNIICTSGSLVAWHKTFENQRNQEFAHIYPEKAKFLMGLVERSIDLVDVFKDSYVDIAFGGSTSIKNILPAIGNQFVYVLKMSSLVSIIGIGDLTRKANELVVTTYRPLEIYTFLILEYLILILIVSFFVRKLESRLKDK